MTDPWQKQNAPKVYNKAYSLGTSKNYNSETESLEFEDNFAPNASVAHLDNTKVEISSNKSKINIIQPLPDSASYLLSLERRLQKIQKGSKLIDALDEKRQQCLRSLLQEDIGEPKLGSITNENLEFDTKIVNSESTVRDIYRHLQPVQPLSVGEIVHILNYDQLLSNEDTHQRQENDTGESDDSEKQQK